MKNNDSNNIFIIILILDLLPIITNNISVIIIPLIANMLWIGAIIK